MRITCEETQAICDKGQYKKTNFFERIKLSFHHLACKKCKDYSTQNTFLSLLLNKCTSIEQTNKKCLSKEEKEDLQMNVEKELQTNPK